MVDYSKVKCVNKNNVVNGMYKSYRFECNITDKESREVLKENGALEEHDKESGKEIKKLVITMYERPHNIIIEDIEVEDIDGNWFLHRINKHNFDIDKLLKLVYTD